MPTFRELIDLVNRIFEDGVQPVSDEAQQLREAVRRLLGDAESSTASQAIHLPLVWAVRRPRDFGINRQRREVRLMTGHGGDHRSAILSAVPRVSACQAGRRLFRRCSPSGPIRPC
jgi:hypothetical protein